MRMPWEIRGTVSASQMPDKSPRTLRRLSDADLYGFIAGWKEGSEDWIAGQVELRRRENATARMALWISFASLIVAGFAALAGCEQGGGYAVDLPASERRFDTLARADRVTCEWQGGTALTEGGGGWQRKKVEGMAPLTFLGVGSPDPRVSGNAGEEPVNVSRSRKALNIIERTLMGNLNTTTIFAGGRGAGEGYYAVTSRHISIEGEPVPSQYFGVCRIG